LRLDLNNVPGFEGHSFCLSEEIVGRGNWCTKEKCKCGGNIFPYASEVPESKKTQDRSVSGYKMPVTTWEELVLCICSSCEKVLGDYHRTQSNFPGHEID
jgi:hypothetical protein